MMYLVVADGERIDRVIEGTEDMADWVFDVEAQAMRVAIRPDPGTNYVVGWFTDADGRPNAVIEQRPTLPQPNKTSIAANGVDEAIFDFPVAVEVKVDNVIVGTTNYLELSSPVADTYVVTVNHWPYLPYRVEIVAT